MKVSENLVRFNLNLKEYLNSCYDFRKSFFFSGRAAAFLQYTRLPYEEALASEQWKSITDIDLYVKPNAFRGRSHKREIGAFANKPVQMIKRIPAQVYLKDIPLENSKVTTDWNDFFDYTKACYASLNDKRRHSLTCYDVLGTFDINVIQLGILSYELFYCTNDSFHNSGRLSFTDRQKAYFDYFFSNVDNEIIRNQKAFKDLAQHLNIVATRFHKYLFSNTFDIKIVDAESVGHTMKLHQAIQIYDMIKVYDDKSIEEAYQSASSDEIYMLQNSRFLSQTIIDDFENLSTKFTLG